MEDAQKRIKRSSFTSANFGPKNVPGRTTTPTYWARRAATVSEETPGYGWRTCGATHHPSRSREIERKEAYIGEVTSSGLDLPPLDPSDAVEEDLRAVDEFARDALAPFPCSFHRPGDGDLCGTSGTDLETVHRLVDLALEGERSDDRAETMSRDRIGPACAKRKQRVSEASEAKGGAEGEGAITHLENENN